MREGVLRKKTDHPFLPVVDERGRAVPVGIPSHGTYRCRSCDGLGIQAYRGNTVYYRHDKLRTWNVPQEEPKGAHG